MKIIALKGKENTGKSHTINIVYSFLLRDGYEQVPGIFRILGNPKFEDCFDILIKDGKKVVGIIGMGDYPSSPKIDYSFEKLLEEIERKECDICICACQNKPDIVSALSKYPHHIIINKTTSTLESEYRIIDFKDAESILKNF